MEAQLLAYVRAKFPSQLPPELQVTPEQFPAILQQILADFTPGATQNRQFFRIAGQSGSGKTSQLLPAVQAQFAQQNLQPITIANRLFAPYHPHAQVIKTQYGAANFRTHTDDFGIIFMFLTLRALIVQGYDLILDVSFADPAIEAILDQLLTTANYTQQITFIAVSKQISDQFIHKRANRQVAASTADEFWRATQLALAYYAQNHPDIPVTVWSAWDLQPVYAGNIGDPQALRIAVQYQNIHQIPPNSSTETALRAAKLTYFSAKS